MVTPVDVEPTFNRRAMVVSLNRPPAGDVWTHWSRWASGRGLRLHRADSSQEVLRTIESEAVLLALLDAELPGVPGLSLVRMIQAIEPEVNCVLVSPRPTRRMMQEALDRGVYSVLPPPLDTDVFADLLVRLGQRLRAN
jgi:DNA-binding NtrC family response regulator